MSKPTTDDQVSLALGRLFAIGARPFQDGDHEEYERCRAIIMAADDGIALNSAPVQKRGAQ